MIIMTLHLTVPPEKVSNAVAVINSIAGPTCVEPGCNQFTLYSNINDDENLMLMVVWESQEVLEGFIKSDDFRKIVEIMELASQAPEISFYTISDISGFELVEALRD